MKNILFMTKRSRIGVKKNFSLAFGRKKQNGGQIWPPFCFFSDRKPEKKMSERWPFESRTAQLLEGYCIKEHK
jgi:hypothetical protein